VLHVNSVSVSVLIVDDENKACANLKNILIEYIDPNINIVGIANSTREADALIARHKPDVIFLDIEMPQENAFRFLERNMPIPYEVVFVTAYDHYAVKAFRLNAVDYILKPISIRELVSAYEKVKSRLVLKSVVSGKDVPYAEIADQVFNKVRPQRITLKNSSGIEWIDFADLFFIEAQSSYSRVVFLKDGTIKEMTMSNPLSEYEEILPEEIFFRVHRSFLVNCKHISAIENSDANQAVSVANYSVPVSRRRFAALVEFLKCNNYGNE
jgi:two-component system LytT family response regulator